VTEVRPGDRVEFTHPSRGTISGTVKTINRRTVTLVDVSDGSRGWRVTPSQLRPVGAIASPAPPVPYAVGDSVEVAVAVADPWTGLERAAGVVTNVGLGSVEVYAGGRVMTLADPRRLRPRPRRSYEEVRVEVRGVYSRLSPENLFADGERSRSAAARLAAVYNRALRALFVEAGHRISEAEAYGP
jgi:hypothetical protein